MRHAIFWLVTLTFLLTSCNTVSTDSPEDLTTLAGPNLIADGGFAAQDSWNFYANASEGVTTTNTLDSRGRYCVWVGNGGGKAWDVLLSQGSFKLTEGLTYDLWFDVVTSAGKVAPFVVKIGQSYSPYSAYAYKSLNAPGGNAAKQTLSFTMTKDEPAAQLEFQLGANAYNQYYCFDNVSLRARTSAEAPPAGSAKTIKSVYFSGPAGIYTRAAFERDWGNIWENGSVSDGRAHIGGRGNEHALKVTLPAGSPGNGANHWGAFIADVPLAARNSAELEYDFKFEHDYDFVQGGKLPGFGGGNNATGGVTRSTRGQGFSSRVMWRGGGRGVAYLYHPNIACNSSGTSCYGEDFQLRWPGSGDDVFFKKNVWYKVRMRVSLGTANSADGKVQVWLTEGGGSEARVLDKSLQLQTGSNYRIEDFLFHLFFGGGDASWAPKSDQTVYIDNIIIRE